MGSQPTLQQDNPANNSVTTIYQNADIVTLNEAAPSAAAVAVRDGKIIAVGNRDEVSSAAGSKVKVIDLAGATLLPGLIDAHGHLSFTAMTASSANVASPPVGPAKTIADVTQILREFAAKVPGDGWVLGVGYDDSLLEEQHHPTKFDLDKVSAERPIAIMHVSAHLMSCNSKCLELANIGAETADPEGGVIRRIADSQEPNGVLEETAMQTLYAALPQPTEEARLAMLDTAQNYYAKHGITTVQDGAAQLSEVELLRTAAAQNRLKLDVVAFPFAGRLGADLQGVEVANNYTKHFRVGGIKLVLDGSPQGKTAWLTQPYLHPPHGQQADYAGYPTLTDEAVNSAIDTAFSKQIPVLAHANGDAAADQLIRAVTAANKARGNLDRRTVMIHAQTAREDQIDAMLTQHIIPSYFSAHTFYWGDWHRDSVFGEQRAKRISPLQSSLDKGLIFTTHNDTPVVPPDMMRLLWASVNRLTRSNQVLGAEQRITPLEALKSVTINAAYQYFEEDRKGSIEVGKLADFTVLDRNPLQVDPLTIKDIQVLQTIKEGVPIYQRTQD